MNFVGGHGEDIGGTPIGTRKELNMEFFKNVFMVNVYYFKYFGIKV